MSNNVSVYASRLCHIVSYKSSLYYSESQKRFAAKSGIIPAREVFGQYAHEKQQNFPLGNFLLIWAIF